MKTIVDELEEMRKTASERAAMYGDSYLRFGAVASGLWPNGLHIESKEDFDRLGVVVQIISKLVRYTGTPRGHKDSAHDLAVYGAMLSTITED